MTMLHALQNRTERHDDPYRHWLVDKPLDDDMLAEIVNRPIPTAPRSFDGTRAADNGGGGIDGKLRCYVGRDNIDEFPALRRFIDQMLATETILHFEQILERDLSGCYLRVEVIADRQGFWLKPHKDIREKLMSLLAYANPYGESESLGTDIYDGDLNVVKTIPYRDNIAYLFAPGDDTWHGLEKNKEIKRERRSLLVNYVTFETDWKLPDLSRLRAAA